MIFFPLCLYFFPRRPCNNCSTFTDSVLGENMARGKSNNMFPTGHNLSLWQYLHISTGGKYMIFSPLCLYFFPLCLYFFLLGHAINCSTFTRGVLGENMSLCVNVFPLCLFLPLAMLFGIYFTFLPRQFLGYELEKKQYNIFSPGLVFFPTCDRKTCKKLMGKVKWYFFPFSIFFPLGPCCIWFPFSDSYGILRQLRYWGVWKWWFLPLAYMYFLLRVNFNDFVMNNPDKCSFFFNHFFFPVYFYQMPFSLLP